MSDREDRTRMETPAAACAALAAIVVGADGIGTLEERRYLSEQMTALPLFDGLDRDGLAALVADMTTWVWSSFPTEGATLTDEAVSDLLGLVREALPHDLRGAAFGAAAELARCDGVSSEEEVLLERIRVGLGIQA